MTRYAERVLPRARTWLLAPGLGILATLSAVPFGATVAVGAGVVATLLAVVAGVAVSPRLEVTPAGFRAGRAFLDAEHVGGVEPLTGADVREAMGPGLRADAHVLYRGWARGAVRVHLLDPADPTPYWLVSTHRPAALARALRADAADGGQAAHSEQTG